MSLYKKTLNKLIKKNISITTAESCTGGLLASSITKIKDTSKIYLGGYITYSNELKIRDLGVKKTTIKLKHTTKQKHNLLFGFSLLTLHTT